MKPCGWHDVSRPTLMPRFIAAYRMRSDSTMLLQAGTIEVSAVFDAYQDRALGPDRKMLVR